MKMVKNDITFGTHKSSCTHLVDYIPTYILTQRAFGAKMTSYQRRCDVITSHRR